MATTTWWGLAVTAVLVFLGALFFGIGIIGSQVKSLHSFRRWTIGTAVFAAVLVLLAAVPVDKVFPCPGATLPTCNAKLKDASAVANAIGPLLLSVSLALASVFYSAGEWYEKFQRFRVLGIDDARADRRGRQSERGLHWQNVLRGTKRRIVISGTTLGGWFYTGWEETRESLLMVLPRVRVEVLLEHPNGAGFAIRADDPGEMAEARATELARPRARQVYAHIARIFEEDQFKIHLTWKQLTFYTYELTPLSVVWADDQSYFTPYLPSVSDSACPEFTVNRNSEIGSGLFGAAR